MVYDQEVQDEQHTALIMLDYINWCCLYYATTTIYCTVKACLSKRHLEHGMCALAGLSLLVIKMMNMLSVNTRA